MNNIDRNFYHSFPRLRPNDNQDQIVNTGIKILKSIRDIGLILAPEIVVWKQFLQNEQFRTITLRQKRISFTELSPNQIEEHGKTFGPFSIEVTIETLRKLGALPVIYLPQQLKDDSKYSTVGSTVVATLRDIQYTIDQLQQLRQVTTPDYLLKQNPQATSVSEDCVLKLQNTDPSNAVVHSYEIPLKNIRDVLNYIGYRNAPFDLMSGILSLVQSLFYPTDDNNHNDVLKYYRQREWRLLSGLGLQGTSQARSLTDDEKNILLDIDFDFWNKQLSDDTSSFRRVDDAVVIKSFNEAHVSEIISTVRVPPEALKEATAIFGKKVVVN